MLKTMLDSPERSRSRTRFENSFYRPEVDGLRAIAVIAVICFHARLSLFGIELTSGGYLGVDVFFVISGYLIAGFILRQLAVGDFSLATFYNRRARRILPALFLVLAFSFTAALLLLTPRQLVDFSDSLTACVFFLSNVFFWSRSDYFSEPNELTPLLHTWSLSVEEQFYVIFPLLLILLTKHARRLLVPFLIIAGATSLVAAHSTNAFNPAGAFYLFQYRAWELLAGAGLAAIEQKNSRLSCWRAVPGPMLGLSMLVAAFVFSGSRGGLGFGSLTVVAGTALVISGGEGSTYRLLSSRPLVAIGVISYSLYLWHQPLFAFARIYSLNTPDNATFLFLAVASTIIAALSWRYVEQPFRDRTVSGRQFALTSIIAGLFLTTGALLSSLGGGFPGRYSQEQQVLLDAAPERGAISINGRSCGRRSIEDACIIGRSGVAPNFAVLGDSHAETLTGSLDKYLKSRSLSAYVYTNAGCPFIANVVERAATGGCDEYMAEALTALRRHNISHVIINDRSTAYILGTRFDNQEGGKEPGAPFPFEPVGFNGSNSNRIRGVMDEWRDTMRRLIDNGVTIYYVLPVPEVGWHVPRTLVKLIARGEPLLTTSLSVYLERNRIMFGLVDEFSTNEQFVPIYPHNVFCSPVSNRCATHENGQIFYTDTDHLSQQGAEKLVAAIARAIDTSRNGLH